MSRDVNGNYSLPAGNPVVSGTLIQSAGWWNPTGTDIATALTDSLSRGGSGGMLAPLKGITGTAGAPTFTFTAEPTLGVFRSSAGLLGIAAGGALTANFSTTAITLIPGVAATPSYSFIGETGLGFYKPAAGQIGLAVGGVNKFIFAGVDDSTGLSLLGKGPVISLARSSDSLANSFQWGSAAVGSSTMRLINTSGGTGWLDIGANVEFGYNIGSVLRFQIVLSTGVAKCWEGTHNVAAASLMQLATSETGSFTGTLTGCTTSPTASFQWTRCGGIVTIVCSTGALQAVSNSTSMTITGLPAGIQPTRSHRVAVLVIDAGVTLPGSVLVSAASGTMTFHTTTAATYAAGTANIVSTGFTNSGTKGIHPSMSFTYHLD